MKVCVAPTRVLSCPDFGGHAWVYANWSRGLLANGIDVFWLERFALDPAPEEALRLLDGLRERLDSIGVTARIALVLSEEQSRRLAPIAEELQRRTVPFEAVAAESDLLLNFFHEMEPAILRRFRRTALVDIDPGRTQLWMSAGQLQVAPHGTYFTIGETVGTATARFPDAGVRWTAIPPAVCLEAWQPAPMLPESPYTTVSTWFSKWQVFGGEAIVDDKRSSFLEFLDLPSRAPARFELALYMADTEAEDRDRRLLSERGWRVQDPREVCGTPLDYRRYVRRSRGEFSCARPSYIRLETGWISDRTLCYLASGRPAVVQYTGPSRFLPDADGLFRFRTLDEAVAAIERVEADHEHHARRARALAEEHFDARKVVARLLETALA